MGTGTHRVNGSVSVNHILTSEGEGLAHHNHSAVSVSFSSNPELKCLSLQTAVLPLLLLMLWSLSIFIRTGERERETNFQQKQLNDTLATPTLATRPGPLPFGISCPGHLACHHSADGWRRSAKDSDVMPTIILPTPSESTGKAKQACKVMGRSFKGCAVVSSLLAKESLHNSSANLSIS